MIANIKILSDDELNYLIDRYTFGVATVGDDVYVVVKCNGYNRMILHDAKKKFTINSPVKRITISKEAINLWLTYLSDYSLIAVQNAINSLIVTYQELELKDIKAQLDNNILKIKTN